VDTDTLTRAYTLGQERHPAAPAAHHAAFANSVAEAVTGWSGGYGGPSMREHWASRLLGRAGTPGTIPFDLAVSTVEEACYGPITLEIARMLTFEACFDDADGEQEEAERLLHEAGEDLDDEDF
jgi:hypothetical protein